MKQSEIKLGQLVWCKIGNAYEEVEIWRIIPASFLTNRIRFQVKRIREFEPVPGYRSAADMKPVIND